MFCIPTETGNKTMTDTVNDSLRDERGMVLIVVLVMLLFLTILGATVLTTTTSELRVAGNYRNMQEAFSNADGSLELAMVMQDEFNSYITAGVDWTGFIYMNAGMPVAVTVLPGGTTAIADVNSDYIGEGKAPRGSGYDESTVASYYNVNIVGRGTNASDVAIDAGVVKYR